MRSHQACVKGLFLLPPHLQRQHRNLCRLLEQRSLLLFIDEYTRRVQRTTRFLSRLTHLVQGQQKESHFRKNQTCSSLSSCRVSLVTLSQDLWVHLNHWRCLSSRVHLDYSLRNALLSQARMLEEMKQSLNLFGLQLLVLMEHYVSGVLSSIGQTTSDSLPREVLEDVLAGTDLYNQAVEEHRRHLSPSERRVSALQQLNYHKPFSLPKSERYHPAAFSVKDLLTILAVHHAEVVAKQLHCRISEQSSQACRAHSSHKTLSHDVSQLSRCSCGKSSWTWEQLQHVYLNSSPLLSNNQPTPQLSSLQTSKETPNPDHHLDRSFSANHQPDLTKPFFNQRKQSSTRDQTRQCHTCISLASLTRTSLETLDLIEPNLEKKKSSGNCGLLKTSSCHHVPALHLCQLDHCVELLLHVLISSTDLLAPPGFHTPTAQETTEQLLPCTDTLSSGSALSNAAHSEVPNKVSVKLTRCHSADGVRQDWTKLDGTAGSDVTNNFCAWSDEDLEKKEKVPSKATNVEPDCVCVPRCVRWMDFDRSLLSDDLLEHYHSLLWSLCNKALWLKLHMPQAGSTTDSINLQEDLSGLQVLHRVTEAVKTGLFLKECKTPLEDVSFCLLAQSEHAHWDSVMCRSVSSALKDKCLRSEGGHSAAPPLNPGEVVLSQTMEFFLHLPQSLLSLLSCRQSNSCVSGPAGLLPSRWALQRQTVSLLLASVQMSTVWVMSKAYQFLSSWSPKKFLLISQGDLRMLLKSLDLIMVQTKTLLMNLDSEHQSSVQNHNLHLLRQKLKVLDGAVCELQTFSSLVMKTFSMECKKMSVEIFERTMPTAGHWRPSHRAGFPSTPSEYASLAAQTVIGQVLEAVAPLSEDARVQALSVTMTAFMEAWMEHILKEKIKFSLQGALQLKKDFDSVREMIRSDESGLSAELHRHLLSLRVFQQVDSAVLCLLQQPQMKPNLHFISCEPFSRCCRTRNRDSIDAVVGSLDYVEGEELDSSFVTSDLPPVDLSTPSQPYLAQSEVLGAVQQDWLDLRMQIGTRRWRLPGLWCLSKTEP